MSYFDEIKILDSAGTNKLSVSAAGAAKIDGSAVTQPISASSLPLPTGAATSANQTSEQTLIGAVTETAPATDTASSGLNGRLQRIAQRITSLITALGSPFQAGGSIGNTTFGITNWLGSTAPTVGQKTMANSLPFVLASDQSTILISDTNDIANTQITTTVAASVTSVLLRAANSTRKQISIRNTSTKVLCICFFTPATTSTPFCLNKDEVWVFDKYKGDIYGIWDTGATGSAFITSENT